MNDKKQINNKLIITQKNNAIYYGYFVDGTPVELYCEPKQQQSLVGNIYAARVEKVADGIGGAFLEIGDGQKCYYPFTKEQQPMKLSPGHENRLCGGDIILVQITKDAVKTKLPVADGNVSLDGKYFVLSIADKRVSLSRKITKPTERERLQKLIEQYIGEYCSKEKSDREDGIAEKSFTDKDQTEGERYINREDYVEGKNSAGRERYIIEEKSVNQRSVTINQNAFLDFGIIVRTNAEGVPEEELKKEWDTLTERYRELMRKAAIAPGKTLLFREPLHYITLGRDLPEKELDEIVTDQPDIFQEFKSYGFVSDQSHNTKREKTKNIGCSNDKMQSTAYLNENKQNTELSVDVKDESMLQKKVSSATKCKITLYEDEYPLEKLYRFDHFYEEATNRQVWLKSGGSLVIEQTEAMVVIDVNTGAVTKKKKMSEDVYFQTNCEAAREIARQLRLRNLSGIILIDFINMKEEKQKNKLMHLLEQECHKDRVRCRVVDMTKLGLVEMTRSKVRKPLREQMILCKHLSGNAM